MALGAWGMIDTRATLARTDLVALVQEQVPLKRRGQSWWGQCPFHAEKTLSFHVRPHKGRYHCFGCGADGDALEWLQATLGLTFLEACEHLSPGSTARDAAPKYADPMDNPLLQQLAYQRTEVAWRAYRDRELALDEYERRQRDWMRSSRVVAAEYRARWA